MSLRQVKELVKQHNLKGLSHLNLKELKAVLTEKNIEIPPREPRVKRKTLVSQATETEEVSSEDEPREVVSPIVESKTEERVVEVKKPD